MTNNEVNFADSVNNALKKKEAVLKKQRIEELREGVANAKKVGDIMILRWLFLCVVGA